jgi:thiol-disulfide isomerase/thioredoxin
VAIGNDACVEERPMKWGVWLVWLAGLWLVIGCGASTVASDLPPTPTPADASLAADFQLVTLDGETVQLSDLRGRYVLINFWATWCPPCRAEMPYIQQLADTHADQLTVLGVNMRETAEQVQPFVAKAALTFPMLLYPDDHTLRFYDVRALPMTFVVDPNGELILRQVGQLQPAAFDEWLAAQLTP